VQKAQAAAEFDIGAYRRRKIKSRRSRAEEYQVESAYAATAVRVGDIENNGVCEGERERERESSYAADTRVV